MQEKIESRLNELKEEYTRGQARLQEVEMRQSALRDTLLRIGGAIQVLQEVLAGDATESGAGPAT